MNLLPENEDSLIKKHNQSGTLYRKIVSGEISILICVLPYGDKRFVFLSKDNVEFIHNTIVYYLYEQVSTTRDKNV